MAPRSVQRRRRATRLADRTAARGARGRRDSGARGAPRPGSPRLRPAHRDRQPLAEGGAGPRAAAGRRCTTGCPDHLAPLGRRRPGGLRLSGRPVGGGRPVLGHGAGGREPGVAGSPRRRPGDLPALRRFGAAGRRPRARRRRRRRARRLRQGPSRAPTRHRHHGRGVAAAVQRVDDRADADAQPDHRAVAPQHTDHRPAARHIHHRNRFDARPASHPGGRRRSRPPPPPSSSPNWKAIAASTPARWAGAMRAATAAGWCPSAARNWPPTGSPRWPTPAAASSPNPTPMAKSPRRQRNSAPS